MYRIGLVISAAWLVITGWWCYVVFLALRAVDPTGSLLDQIKVFDQYETNITRGAIAGSVLFSIRVIMFLQWPEARLLRRTWRR